MIEVETIDDLPIPKPGDKGIELPRWSRFVPYRATAWAYLNRDDGGEIVIFNGKNYRLKRKRKA